VAPPSVRSTEERGVLVVTSGSDAGRVHPCPPGGPVVLGRSEDCQVRLEDAGLSRVHARVLRVAGGYVVEDARSRNGTFLNDRRILAPAPLRDGDRLRLGNETTFRFSLVDEAEERVLQDLHRARVQAEAPPSQTGWEERTALAEDLAQAADFQRRALRHLPEVPGATMEVLYRPFDVVGGDLYRITAHEKRVLRVFLADATGHGVKASLTTMLILGEYELLQEPGAGPGDVLRALNDRLATTFGHLSLRFTATCLDIDLGCGLLRYATAAHPAPLVACGGVVSELEGGGPYLGALPGLVYPEHEAHLGRGDHVFAFTDGATAAFSPEGVAFGDERLQATIARAVGQGSSTVAAVSSSLDDFVGPGRALSDDVAFIAVRWMGS
jgi:hypothetical protein